MADSKAKRGPADRRRVSLKQRHEVWYWCKELVCTEDELKAAVLKVGDAAKDVRRWLAAPKLLGALQLVAMSFGGAAQRELKKALRSAGIR